MKNKVVVIGVTGHRVLRDLEYVSRAVDLALTAIQQNFPADDFKILSPLAEGADRLVARQAIHLLSARLVAPLPLDRADYLLDFETETSKQEFKSLTGLAQQVIQLPPEDSRTASYLAVGMFVLTHCDVLLALWDGKPARGIGGTGQIVEEARRLGKPLAWVPVNNPTDSSTPEVRFERFPNIEDEAGDQ